MMWEWGVLMLLGLVGSMWFSATEMVFITLDPSRLNRLVPDRMAHWFRSRPEEVFSSILFGNNLANALVAIAMTAALLEQGQGTARAVLFSGAGSTVFIVVFGEILPKILARRHAASLAAWLFPMLYAFSRVVGPAVFPLARWMERRVGGARKELLSLRFFWNLIRLRRTELERQLAASRVLEETWQFLEQPVAAYTIPVFRMVRVEASRDRASLQALLCRIPWQRLFVYEDRPDQILGVIHAKDLLDDSGAWTQHIRPVAQVYEDWPVSRVLQIFRTSPTSIALVYDEFGHLKGFVSDEILFENLLSDLYPLEAWRDGEVVSTFVLLKSLKLRGLPIEGEDTETLSHWILRHLGEVPARASFRIGPLRFEVVDRTPTRIERVRIGAKGMTTSSLK
ncbi:MAG: CNNM domain-containing protein [Candidatus Hydrothermae bacterium]|nr:CNNM domain-containing protein [Candidatus Hydrothermae bacterium]